MNQKLLPLLVLTFSGLLCGCDQPVSQGAGSTVQSAKLKIGFVARRSNGYWSLVRFGFDIAAVTLGDVELDFRTPTGRTVEDKNQTLSNLVSSGVQTVAISTLEDEKQVDFWTPLPQTSCWCALTMTRAGACAPPISGRTVWPPAARLPGS